MMRYFLVILYCTTCALSISDSNSNPRVVIVGSGPSGIAAASKLLDNGFTDVTILEAENRTGGRVYSVEFGEYIVDLGGQWVHGEKDNVAFELAWPLGLIERFHEKHNMSTKFFGSSESSLPLDTSLGIKNYYDSLIGNITDIDNFKTGTFGEYAEAKCYEYFQTHPEISPDLHRPLCDTLNLMFMAGDSADNWYDVSIKATRDYPECEGDQMINWKNRTYSTILDILMKKFPNPEDELPVLNNTRTDSKVIKIDYNNDTAPIKITTEDGKEYLADHVIFTPSLGVLKAKHEQLFSPPLPEKKVLAINNIGFGHVGKILLYYENPWWDTDENNFNVKYIYWTESDRKEIENDPEKKWMLGLVGFFPVEHKPKLLLGWMSSNHSIEMELIPEELFCNQTSTLIHRFFGHDYNITEPTEIRRSMWNNNENFQGTYTYRGVESDLANVNNEDLAEPIMRNDKPILQFAGEATAYHYSTVHGAIETGWREADRLIHLYSTETLEKNEG